MSARCGIIFVHGIVGNNHIFDLLAPHVPAHVESKFITLKGHGDNALAFSKTSMAEWKSQVATAVKDMQARCHHVLAVGHSMGCLLIMEQAAQGNLSGLFLLNPPLRIKPRLSLLSNALRVMLRATSTPVAQAAKDAYGISLDFNPLHYYGWPLRYIELFNEIRRVKNVVINHLHCPVLTILSANDEMVSLSSAKELTRRGHSEIITLPHSTHYYYSPADRNAITTQFNHFLRQSPA
nr:alpha/beta fold hydrolase [Bacteroides sp.]